ncbi:putative lipid II flippase FtsW [Thermoleophilia bacterium SCSIO 60948]|nr:putative lipid II flippase FtsW [Thermoleophilia bacterium SCSIO 60948]
MKLGSMLRGGSRKRGQNPVEYSLLLTATLCLLAFGVVMVFSASSTTSLFGESGDSAYYLKRTALFGVVCLGLLYFLSTRGVPLARRFTPVLLAGSIFLLVLLLVPGVATPINGAKRWIGSGFAQVQPSEFAKLALILYSVHLLAARPQMTRDLRSMGPVLLMVGLICALVVFQPDLGTAMISCFTIGALLIAAGARIRDIGKLAGVAAAVILVMILIEPYRMERLTGFINPGHDPAGSSFQLIQAEIAMGSGGLFGVGLGESLQKAFFLPEAHTDMIGAVIGEELGFVGIAMLVGLYGLFGYAGLRTAQKAKDRYGKLLAAGLTSLIVLQAILNLFALLGLAPLTGVPLPFVSYGNSSMLTMMVATGLLLHIARGGTASASAARPRASGGAERLRVIDGEAGAGRSARRAAKQPSRSQPSRAKGRHSRRGNGGSRRAGARGGRRAAR